MISPLFRIFASLRFGFSVFVLIMACAGAVSAAPALGLRWTDNSDNETGFTIERALGAGEFAPIANVPAGATTYVDEGLAPATTYRYRVCAYNTYGASAWSNIATGTTRAAGQPPTAPAGSEAAPPPDYQPPIIVTLAPGQSVLIAALTPTGLAPVGSTPPSPAL